MSSTVTKTIDNAVAEARAIVNDSNVNAQRNPDATFVAILNTALRVVYSLRPDAFIGNFSTGPISTVAVVTYTTADLQVIDGTANPTPPSPATPFPCDDRQFFDPVIQFMAARIEISDDEYTMSSPYAAGSSPRAVALMASFKQQLVGGP